MHFSALTEKIAEVLVSMKCKYLVEPHQIQGLDSVSIFPAVQWLVKKVIETRAMFGDYVRQRAMHQYCKEVDPTSTPASRFRKEVSTG